MKGLKDAGLLEAQRLKQRTIRNLALRRISVGDCTYIVKRIDEIEARIVGMIEYPEEGAQ